MSYIVSTECNKQVNSISLLRSSGLRRFQLIGYVSKPGTGGEAAAVRNYELKL